MTARIDFTKEQEKFVIDNFGKVTQCGMADKLGVSQCRIRRLLIERKLIHPIKGGTELEGNYIKRGRKPGTTNPKNFVKCVCPGCGTKHVMHIKYWTGKIPARKYCPSCEHKTTIYN